MIVLDRKIQTVPLAPVVVFSLVGQTHAWLLAQTTLPTTTQTGALVSHATVSARHAVEGRATTASPALQE